MRTIALKYIIVKSQVKDGWEERLRLAQAQIEQANNRKETVTQAGAELVMKTDALTQPLYLPVAAEVE